MIGEKEGEGVGEAAKVGGWRDEGGTHVANAAVSGGEEELYGCGGVG